MIDLPGMSAELLKHVPPQSNLGKWLVGKNVVPMTPCLPAVTCSMQATMTTGTLPKEHGIIANGIATVRSKADQGLVDASSFGDYRTNVSFWEQSNQFLQQPRFWQDENGISRFKTAMLFFQNSMPGFAGAPQAAADVVLTPKPEHGADGKLASLLWAEPRELVGELFAQLGPFPLMNYWGPLAGIAASQWIANAASFVWTKHRPQLQWTYIPHLDYDLQRFGKGGSHAIKAVQDVSAAMEGLIESVQSDGGTIVLLSEYAMHEVSASVPINRMLAEAGLLVTRESEDGQLIDYRASRAWAMVDHQVAHIYTNDAEATTAVRELFATQNGVKLMGRREQEDCGLNHPRSGDLVALGDGVWFDYRWWINDERAPKFAGMIDIHRKPGYDPLELFWDRANNRISFDARLVKGSHGVPHPGEAIYVSDEPAAPQPIPAAQVARLVMKALDY